jgi:hypothetical protein
MNPSVTSKMFRHSGLSFSEAFLREVRFYEVRLGSFENLTF